MSKLSNWTTYWRNTLADGERNEIDPSALDKNKVLQLKPEQISIDDGIINTAIAVKFHKVVYENLNY